MVESNGVQEDIHVVQFQPRLVRICHPITVNRLDDFQDHVFDFSDNCHLLGLSADGSQCSQELPGDLIREVDIGDREPCMMGGM